MTASATVANVRSTTLRHALPIPQAFVDAVDQIASRYATPPTPREDLAALVADAVDRGVDPYEDTAVRTALVRGQHGTTIAAALAHAREVAFAELLEEHKTTLLAGWRELWAASGATVAAAARTMPGTDFTRPGSVTDAGPSTARLAQWSEAHAAATLLAGIATAVGTLVAPARPEWCCLIGAPLDAATHDALLASDHARTAWGAALHGVPLDLATSQQQVDNRVAELRAERVAIANAKPVRPSYL